MSSLVLMRLTSGLILVVATLLIATTWLAAPASAEGIVFREVGDLSKECRASSSVTYTWFVYNGNATSYLLEVSVDQSSGFGWSSHFSQEIFVLSPAEEVFVNLTVVAEADVSAKTVEQAVTFTFTDLGNATDTTVFRSVVTTEMMPAWSAVAPGRNKLLGTFENPLPAPFDNNYVTFLLNLAIWSGVALFVAFVLDPAVRMFTKRTKTDLDDRVLSIIRKPLFALIVVYGLVSSLYILPLTERQVAITYESYGIVLIAIVTFVVYKVFKEVLITLGKRWAARTSSEIDDVLVPVIEKLGGVLILLFGAIGIVNYLGYDITFLLAGVGVFGLVVAFAAQDALSNFFSGIFLLLDRPFVEGDYITLATGELCRVEKIGIRSTRLYEVFQHDYIILPNNKLVNDKVVNLEEPNEQGKATVKVGVAYGTDVRKVERILLEEANSHPNVVKEVGKEPVVRFTDFGDSALMFNLIVWVDNFMNQWKVAHELRMAINDRFAKEGIEIPFPQRTVYIKEMPNRS